MDIMLTDAAKKQLDKILAPGQFLRMELVRSGCCGFALNFYTDRKRKDDQVLSAGGYELLYTEREKPLISAIKEIDFKRNGLFRDFKAVMR